MDDKKHMRFLAACFTLTIAEPKKAVQLADELMEELYGEKNIDNVLPEEIEIAKKLRAHIKNYVVEKHLK
jgi:hypothetical protein